MKKYISIIVFLLLMFSGCVAHRDAGYYSDNKHNHSRYEKHRGHKSHKEKKHRNHKAKKDKKYNQRR